MTLLSDGRISVYVQSLERVLEFFSEQNQFLDVSLLGLYAKAFLQNSENVDFELGVSGLDLYWVSESLEQVQDVKISEESHHYLVQQLNYLFLAWLVQNNQLVGHFLGFMKSLLENTYQHQETLKREHLNSQVCLPEPTLQSFEDILVVPFFGSLL